MLVRMAADRDSPMPFPNIALKERVDPQSLVGGSSVGPSMKPWDLHPLVWHCWLELLLSVSSAAVGDGSVQGMRKRKRQALTSGLPLGPVC